MAAGNVDVLVPARQLAHLALRFARALRLLDGGAHWAGREQARRFAEVATQLSAARGSQGSVT